MTEIEIEAFRVGKFTSMCGSEDEYTLADIEALAASYDPILAPSPVVIGHPQHDTPAYGWIKSAKRQGEKIVLTLSDLAKDFVSLLKEKRYRKVSISLFPPDHPANPKPGQAYIKHIGFLGASPPAVTGLKTVDLTATGSESIYQFDIAEQPTLKYTVNYADDLEKEDIIEDVPKPKKMINFLKDLRTMANLSIDELAELTGLSSDQLTAFESGEDIDSETYEKIKVAFASLGKKKDEETTEDMVTDDKEEKEEITTDMSVDPTEQLAALRTDFELQKRRLAGVEKCLNQERQQLQEERKVLERERVASFCDGLVKDFKIKPDQKDETIELILATPDQATKDFTVGKTPRSLLMNRLQTAPSVVDMKPIDLTDDGQWSASGLDFTVPSEAQIDPDSMKLAKKAKEYQSKHPDLSFPECVMKVANS